MWFGTRGGLNKYDGYDFTTYKYDPNNKKSLSNNYVWSILKDRSEKLWFVTYGGGLNRYDPETDSFIRYQHDKNNSKSLSSDVLWTAYEDRSGVIWVGTEKGLDRFDKTTETFTHFQNVPNNSDSLSHNTVSQICEDEFGDLWVGTYGGGLNKFDRVSGKFVRYQSDMKNPNSLSNDNIWVIRKDRKGILWIGTEGGLNKFDPKNKIFVRYQHDDKNLNSLSHDTVLSIHEDNREILWIGTSGGGLNQFDSQRNRFIRYQQEIGNPESLSNNSVWYIYEDILKALWICTDNAINKYDYGKEKIEHFYNKPWNTNSLSDSQVSAIYKDGSDMLWLGTYGGLNKFNRKNNTFIHYLHDEKNPDSLISNVIKAISPDINGNLWLGTSNGLDKFDPVKKTFVHYLNDPNNSNSLNLNVIFSVINDTKGIVWIGLSGKGVDKFDPSKNTFTHYVHDENNFNSLVNDWTNCLLEDSEGFIWIGTESGVSQFDPAKEIFTNYTFDKNNPNSLSNNLAETIYEDSLKRIWIGTGDGLNRFDKSTKQFTVYREKNGLASNHVFGILEDKQGYIWISTEKGLSKLNLNNENFRNYNKWDGLQSNIFLVGSCFKSNDGELFFGGINGFNAFYPDKLNDNPNIPPVVLTDFNIFNNPIHVGGNSPLQKHINIAEEVTLSYKQSFFSFKFASLNFRSPQNNQYAYMMEGFDKKWNYIDYKRRFASYTNLDPGKYIFKVKASNNDGVWNEKGASIKITITPPIWKTWWAYASYAIFFVFSIAGYVRYKTKAQTKELAQRNKELEQERLTAERLRQIDKMKDEFLANTSHELRTPLNGIIGLTESIIDGAIGIIPQIVKENLLIVVQSGKRLANLVNDILDFSKLKNKDLQLRKTNVDIHELTEIVLKLSKPLIAGKSLELKNEIPIDIPAVIADENRLQQIIYNLLGNAIKFTDKGQVIISAQLKNDKVQINVSDTGIGIPKEKFEDIFKSFEQVDGSIEREYGGTGLGLAVTKSLIELHGGKIWVDSQLGHGSIFSFTLPVTYEKPEIKSDKIVKITTVSTDELMSEYQNESLIETSDVLQQRKELEDVRGKIITSNMYGFKILVVDDEAVNLQVIKNNLCMAGAESEIVHSGIEALEKLDYVHPDLILLDIMMPKMNGYETARRIREKYSKEEMPIIFISAKSHVSDLVYSFESGGNDYITKPISKNELFTRMNFHIEHSKDRKNLKKAEEKYRQIFENAIEGIFQISTKGNFISANASMAKIMGYNSSKDLMSSVTNMLEESFAVVEDRNNFINILKKNGQVTGMEVHFSRKDNSIFFGSISARITFNDIGEPFCYEGTVVDITERKEKEKAEREREAANASAQARSYFIANMSHEIRNPMNAILGFTGLALKTGLNDKQKDYLNKIKTSSQTLLGIINDILDFSKVDAGKLELVKADFMIDDVLDSMSDMFCNKISEKGIEIIISVDPSIPVALVGDSLRLSQIIMNLMTNAIKFTDKGEVVLYVSLVDKKDDFVLLKFSVKDTGIGISEEDIAMLFTPFTQVNIKNTRKFGGTGLGLAISKKLTEMMGGEIWAESMPGKGSVFNFTARFGLQISNRPPVFLDSHFRGNDVIHAKAGIHFAGKLVDGYLTKDKEIYPEFREIRVLVVDDNLTSCETMVSLLKSFNFLPDSALSGEDALQKLTINARENRDYSLVIVDHMMPDMDGVKLSERIRENPIFRNIPIIMMTAFGIEEIQIQASKLGVNSFLIKPIKRSVLLDTIMKLFGKKIEVKSDEKGKTETADNSIQKFKGLKVLLVEDNSINQQVAKEILNLEGIIVIVANNGEEAVDLVNKNFFDIVLMDIEMPVMDGFESARLIRKNITRKLPIIAMTAHVFNGYREKCLESGMDDYITKPIVPEELFKIIKNAVPLFRGAA
ncbi:MAG: response regulator [Desulfobacterales bacterium]|nr:response regulator [Desulfobacterales bacterium]